MSSTIIFTKEEYEELKKAIQETEKKKSSCVKLARLIWEKLKSNSQEV